MTAITDDFSASKALEQLPIIIARAITSIATSNNREKYETAAIFNRCTQLFQASQAAGLSTRDLDEAVLEGMLTLFEAAARDIVCFSNLRWSMGNRFDVSCFCQAHMWMRFVKKVVPHLDVAIQSLLACRDYQSTEYTDGFTGFSDVLILLLQHDQRVRAIDDRRAGTSITTTESLLSQLRPTIWIIVRAGENTLAAMYLLTALTRVAKDQNALSDSELDEIRDVVWTLFAWTRTLAPVLYHQAARGLITWSLEQDDTRYARVTATLDAPWQLDIIARLDAYLATGECDRRETWSDISFLLFTMVTKSRARARAQAPADFGLPPGPKPVIAWLLHTSTRALLTAWISFSRPDWVVYDRENLTGKEDYHYQSILRLLVGLHQNMPNEASPALFRHNGAVELVLALRRGGG